MKRSVVIFLFSVLFQFSFAQWNTDRIMRIGEQALYRQDYLLSIQYFNQVINAKPYLATPYVLRGIAKNELGDYLGAEQDCSKAIELNPFLPRAYWARGVIRKTLKKYSGSISDLDKALELSPENKSIIVSRAETYRLMEKYSKAIKDLELFQKLDDNSLVYYEIGRVYLAQKDTVKALENFDKYIKKNPSKSDGYSIRGLLKLQMKDEKGAFEDYSSAIENKSKFVGDYINRGFLNEKKNRFNDALNDYSMALKIDENSKLAYYNRGLLRTKLGDTNNAIKDLEWVVKKDSSNYQALWQKALLELQVGQLKKAEKDSRIILAKNQFFVPAYALIAEAKKKAGDRNGARHYQNIAKELQQNNAYYKRKQKQFAQNRIDKELNYEKRSKSNFLKDALTLKKNKQDNEQYENYLDTDTKNQNTTFNIEPNFSIRYSARSSEKKATQTNTYHSVLADFNLQKSIDKNNIRIGNDTLNLQIDEINLYFENIKKIIHQIENNDSTKAEYYVERALNYALVKDYQNAITDLDKAIQLKENCTIAYFIRSNVLQLFIDENSSNLLINKVYRKQIFSDLNKVIELNPKFSFAYFNLGNYLYRSQKYKLAIKNYKKAIENDPYFAESYFNMALAYRVLKDVEKTKWNLSKAGELGIVRSYKILKEFK